MTASYRQILEQLRQYFPQPVADRVHDAYFVFTILRALDPIDGMKSKLPLFGVGGRLHYERALKSKIRRDPSTPEEVSAELVKQFEGLPVWGHSRSLEPSLWRPGLRKRNRGGVCLSDV